MTLRTNGDELLLAVDLGVRTGLALFSREGRLIWYRSQNFGNMQRLRRGAHGLIRKLKGLTHIVIEGGGPVADIWEREAMKQQIHVKRVYAEEWRRSLLYERERRSGSVAKRFAGDLAKKVIDWSDADRPVTLRDDTAEAILIGFWSVIHFGWLKNIPETLRAVFNR